MSSTRRRQVQVLVASLIGGILSVGISTVPADAEAKEPCEKLKVIGVRGSGEKSDDHFGYGRTVKSAIDQIVSLNASAFVSINYEPIEYPAVPVRVWNPDWYANDYADSVTAGKAALKQEIRNDIRDDCRYLYLIGYSQGAHIVGDVYQSLSPEERSRIGGVALIADPKFMGGEGSPINQGSYRSNRNGIWDANHAPRSFAASEDQFKVRSFCMDGDPVCNWTPQSTCLPTCPHTKYDTKLFPSSEDTYTTKVARWILKSKPPVITTESVAPATVGATYDARLRTADGREGKWSVVGGTLPGGVNLDPASGHIQGVPKEIGSFSISVRFRDRALRYTTRGYAITVGKSTDPNPAVQLRGKIARVGDGRSWYVDLRGGKHSIPDGGTYECLVAQGTPVVETDASVVRSLSAYEDAKCVRAERGDIIRHSDGDAHLLNNDWSRSSIPDGNMYECLRLNGHKTVDVPRYYILDHTKAADANFSCYDPAGVNGKAVRASDGSSWYVDKRGAKHSIPDGGTYECIAAQAGAWNYVVPRAWLTQTKNEDAKCVRAAPGNIIKTGDGDSYLVNAGWTRSWIPSANAFQCVRAEGGRTVVDGVPRYYIDDLTKAGDISFPSDACILRKSNGTAYFLNGQTKREWIPDTPTWDCEVGRGIRVVNANDAVVDGLAEVGWHYCLNKANLRGKMLRHTDGDVHYIHPDDTRTWIPDQFTYGCRQRAGVQQAETRWREYVNAFRETGWDYCYNRDTFTNRYIAHPDGDRHYVTSNGVRHYVQSSAAMNCLNARNGAPATVRWREYINATPEGDWAVCGDTLYRNQNLDRGQWLHSSNGYRFVMQDDGNAVVYHPNGTPIWAAGVNGSAKHIKLHNDGCLARVNYDGQWSWQKACNQGGDRLVMQTDGNLVLYAGSRAVWASKW